MQHEHCPLCGQRTAIYARTMRANQVLCLRLLNKNPYKFEGVKANEISDRTNLISDFSKLRHWGLIEPGKDPNTWKITARGIAFLEGKISVVKYVFIFDGKVVEQPEDSTVTQELLYWYDIMKIETPTAESAIIDSTRMDDGLFIIPRERKTKGVDYIA